MKPLYTSLAVFDIRENLIPVVCVTSHRHASPVTTRLTVVQTDLIPPLPLDFESEEFITPKQKLTFADSDAYNFVADVVSGERTIEIYLTIARTASEDTKKDVAGIACERALEIARQQGSTEQLADIYQNQIRGCIDRLGWRCKDGANEVSNRYIELGATSDSEVLQCIGVIQYQNGDRAAAVKTFEAATEVESSHCADASARLFLILFEMGDYEGVMRAFESSVTTIVADWAASFIGRGTYIFRTIMHAARERGLVGELRRALIRGTHDARCRGSEAFNATFRALYNLYLGWICCEYEGRYEDAIKQLQRALFEHDDLFRLQLFSWGQSELLHSQIATLAELILSKATSLSSSSDTTAGELLSLLEALQRRTEVFLKVDGFAANSTNIVDFPLAKLYLHRRETKQARATINRYFRSSITLLEGDYNGSKHYGYSGVGRLLFLRGQTEAARVAFFLKRQSARSRGQGVELYDGGPRVAERKDGEAQDSERESKVIPETVAQSPMLQSHMMLMKNWQSLSAGLWMCAQWHMCEDGFLLKAGQTTYACTSCLDVELWENCYQRHVAGTSTAVLHACNPRHEFIECSTQGMKDYNKYWFAEQEGNTFNLWLDKVKKDWKSGRRPTEDGGM